jgi:hypothetical protein
MSVRMEQIGPHSLDFHEIWYLKKFRKSAEKITGFIKSDKSNEYFTWRRMHIYDIISLNSA